MTVAVLDCWVLWTFPLGQPLRVNCLQLWATFSRKNDSLLASRIPGPPRWDMWQNWRRLVWTPPMLKRTQVGRIQNPSKSQQNHLFEVAAHLRLQNGHVLKRVPLKMLLDVKTNCRSLCWDWVVRRKSDWGTWGCVDLFAKWLGFHGGHPLCRTMINHDKPTCQLLHKWLFIQSNAGAGAPARTTWISKSQPPKMGASTNGDPHAEKPKCSLHQDVARWKLKQNINKIRNISCEKVWDYKDYPMYLMVRSKQNMKTYLHKIPCLLKQSFPAVDVDDGINLEICAPLCSPWWKLASEIKLTGKS